MYRVTSKQRHEKVRATLEWYIHIFRDQDLLGEKQMATGKSDVVFGCRQRHLSRDLRFSQPARLYPVRHVVLLSSGQHINYASLHSFIWKKVSSHIL